MCDAYEAILSEVSLTPEHQYSATPMLLLQSNPLLPPPASLLELPAEVILHICLPLPPSSLASMERTCSSLRCSVLQSGIWAWKLRRANKASPFSVISRAVTYVEQRGLRGGRGFKVLLGLRRVVKRECWKYLHEMRLLKDTFKVDTNFSDLGRLIKKRVTMKVEQIKAWSEEKLDNNAGYEELENHKELCDVIFGEDDDFDVVRNIQEMKEEGARRFQFQRQKEVEDVREKLRAVHPEIDQQ